ncbi:MAG TPA: CPXCG motif-containing cysteine-rich protein [Gemmatimonadaceae bacterium]|nr:CPXCG motif-containing cysteine-rich protein [Gemmatimonadaceae bacterium]
MTPLREDDDSLDEEFPLGDGTAETEATVNCPYCAEEIEIAIDPGGGEAQQYVQDCEVCCQPWQVTVNYDIGGHAEVSVTALDE